jgi:hypothetical protein
MQAGTTRHVQLHSWRAAATPVLTRRFADLVGGGLFHSLLQAHASSCQGNPQPDAQPPSDRSYPRPVEPSAPPLASQPREQQQQQEGEAEDQEEEEWSNRSPSPELLPMCVPQPDAPAPPLPPPPPPPPPSRDAFAALMQRSRPVARKPFSASTASTLSQPSQLFTSPPPPPLEDTGALRDRQVWTLLNRASLCHSTIPCWREGRAGGLTREVETPLPSNHPRRGQVVPSQWHTNICFAHSGLRSFICEAYTQENTPSERSTGTTASLTKSHTGAGLNRPRRRRETTPCRRGMRWHS